MGSTRWLNIRVDWETDTALTLMGRKEPKQTQKNFICCFLRNSKFHQCSQFFSWHKWQGKLCKAFPLPQKLYCLYDPHHPQSSGKEREIQSHSHTENSKMMKWSGTLTFCWQRCCHWRKLSDLKLYVLCYKYMWRCNYCFLNSKAY